MIGLLAFLLLAGACVAYAFWVYTRAELPVAGRRALATLRAAALLLLLALLFNPGVPWAREPQRGTRWVLLDASLSMRATDGQGGTAWETARARAEELAADGWTVVPFGAGVEAAVDTSAGASARSELTPALRLAVEAGAREIRVLSDLRLHDPVEVEGLLGEVPVAVSFERLPTTVSNAGVAMLRVSAAGRRGGPLPVEVDLFAEGVGDSLAVEVREEGRVVATRSVAAPAPGRLATALFDLPPPRGEGRVRYSAQVAGVAGVGPDALPDDDEAVAYASVGFADRGLVLVSLAPDWEPRYLLPVLGQVTGLPVTGYLRVGPDAFLPMGAALTRGATVDSVAVRRAVSQAALLVLHGVTRETDAWGISLASLAPRRVVWPHDRAAAASLGVEVGPVQRGEWYASSNLPPSPVAGALAGLDFAGFPPLADFFLVNDWVGVSPPLQVQLGGTGRAEAAMILDRSGGARQVVPLTRGFWRWAAREGAPRQAYRRLWAALAGWLLEEDGRLRTVELRPERWVTPRGEETRWLVPAEVDSATLVVQGPDGDTVQALGLGPDALASSGRLSPGAYSFLATDPGGDTLGAGRFDVARTTDELLPRPLEPDAPPAEALTAGSRRGGDLRTMIWPYLLLLALLCAEWVGRRRTGLR